ncbi:MAG: AAA family ATPase [Desulfomonile tiedjei]|nr:AAA family ATPase [Desulfomonile tiedjei]
MIKRIHTKNVGPAPELAIEFADRLNLLTGDNGLGKTFFLDVAWWVQTGTWAGEPAWPDPRFDGDSRIGRQLAPETSQSQYEDDSFFNSWHQEWQLGWGEPGSAIVIYGRVDEGFSVWDPVRNGTSIEPPRALTAAWPEVYNFSQESLWNGLKSAAPGTLSLSPLGDPIKNPRPSTQVLCNGLIRDWVEWSYRATPEKAKAYETLTKVMETLSPDPEREAIKPDHPIRVSVSDVRDVPTIRLPYYAYPVPVIYASAGMKRILSLAYVLVWCWYEHQQACRILKQEPANDLVILIDEVEAHLHPKWQRSILPAILSVTKVLSEKMNVQIVATTHSPLLLASLEPEFDEAKDRVIVFDEEDGKITISPFQWAKYGDSSDWLTSPVFGLRRATSKEADRVLEAAYAYMRHDDMKAFSSRENREEVQKEIQRDLMRLLPEDDPFLVEWDYFVKREKQRPEAHDSL